MNLNIIAYSIYVLVTGFTIIKVGFICYQNGTIFMANIIPDDTDFCLKVNNMLLIGYYLLNIGYAILALSGWSTIYTLTQMTEVISRHIAIIICILAGLHYFNLFWITRFLKNLKQ
ncbi:hypothetical protein [Aquimarina aquimarini]|uniref:hypothetical protein n=1 Tax=Aquimarina aquimarini TaxID=1191734 RepID=UPI000D551830|nr:hypothetical protein [Aquimarina aquimarini]